MRPPKTRESFTARDGTPVLVRPMQPEDRELERVFVHNLSPISKYFRFFAAIRDLSPKMLDRLTRGHYPHELALIATINDGKEEKQIGVARYARSDSPDSVEFAVVVADEWHGRGVGGYLLQSLFVAAQQAGFSRMEGSVLRTNSEMLKLAKELGFDKRQHSDDAEVVEVWQDL